MKAALKYLDLDDIIDEEDDLVSGLVYYIREREM